MHFDWFAFSGDVHGSEGDDHAWFKETGFNSSNWNSSNTSNLVYVLEGKSEWLILGSLGLIKGIKGIDEDGTSVPFHVLWSFDHVISNPTGYGDEWNLVWVVPDLLQVVSDFFLDFFVSLLVVVDWFVVHLVHANNDLFDSHGEGQECVFSGLSVLGNTSFEFSSTWGDNEDSNISLWGSSDHVLDEISVTWGINDGEDWLGSLELPECDINGDTSLSFSLEFI